MKIIPLSLSFLGFFFVFSSCSHSENPKASSLKPATSLAGIWTMEDSLGMAKFLKVQGIKKGNYCLDFKPESNVAYVRFLESQESFKVRVQQTGDYQYRLINENRNTWDVRITTSSTYSEYFKDGITFDWHFTPFTFDPLDPGASDGDRAPEHSTLISCVDSLRAIKEEAQAQTEEFKKFPPFKDFQTPPKSE